MSAFITAKRGLSASAIILGMGFVVSCTGADPAVTPDAAPAEAAVEAVEAAVNPAPESATAPEAPLKGAAPAATQPAAEPAYVGTWGNDLAQCAIEQEYEQPPMIMRADGFDQHEAHCEFDTVTETGPAQWSAAGSCSVEGDLQDIDYNMAIVDGNLLHWSGDARKEAWTLVRCPE